MLNNYEEGLNVKDLDIIFSKLKEELIPIIKNVVTSKNYDTINSKNILKYGPFDETKQAELSKDIAKRILNEGNYDISKTEHPFMAAIGKGDCRVIIGFEDNSIISLGSTTHESGHALYAMNID
jgi:carboxypeptidase Taq